MFKKYYKIALLILLAIVVISQCHSPKRSILKEYKETRLFLGAYVTIHCFFDKEAEIVEIIQECWQRLEEIQISMNAHSSVGHVARINESGHYGLQVPDDVYGLVKDSIKFSRLSEGAFDITVFPLIELWKNAEKEGQLPKSDLLKFTIDKVGYQQIKLEKDNMISLLKKDMKIDLGAIAKGYAVDEVARILLNNHFENFMIDAGGDIYCHGKNKGQKPWKIGIQDPRNKDKIIDMLKIVDAAVTTSGNYERFFEINGQRYSHIINPVSGYPQDLVISSTIIAPTALEADAYATAMSVMGGKRGMKLLNSLKNVEGIIIENKHGGIKKYRSKHYSRLK